MQFFCKYICAHCFDCSPTYVISIIVSNCQHCDEQQFRTLSLTDFTPTNIEEVQKLLSKMNKTTCKLDPFFTSIIMQYPQYFTHFYVYIISLCFSSGVYPTAFKSAIVKPLIKKPTLDCEVLKNYRPISNLPFLSKLTEKVIAQRLVSHMQDTSLVEKFQSAYKAHHSTETSRHC